MFSCIFLEYQGLKKTDIFLALTFSSSDDINIKITIVIMKADRL